MLPQGRRRESEDSWIEPVYILPQFIEIRSQDKYRLFEYSYESIELPNGRLIEEGSSHL